MTFISKYVFPFVWLTFSGYLIYIGFTDTENLSKSGEFKWGALFFWLLSLLIFCFTSFPLKVVSLDEQFLYISNFFKMISTPISNIRKVEVLGFGSSLIKVTLKAKTEFGTEILFVARGNYPQELMGFGGVGQRVARELREMAGIKNEMQS